MKRIKSTFTRVYNEVKAEQFLSKYLKISNSKLTKKADDALEFAKKIYPLTLKLISDELLHKSSVTSDFPSRTVLPRTSFFAHFGQFIIPPPSTHIPAAPFLSVSHPHSGISPKHMQAPPS